MYQISQIDLTKLGRIVREHPEVVKKVQFKDGEHLLINGTIRTSNFPDEYHTEIMSAKPKDVKPQSKEEWKYWEVGTTKLMEEENSQPQQTSAPVQSAPVQPTAPTQPTEELPF